MFLPLITERFYLFLSFYIRGGATDIKIVWENRGAAGAEASAEGKTMEAPYAPIPSQPTTGSGGAS